MDRSRFALLASVVVELKRQMKAEEAKRRSGKSRRQYWARYDRERQLSCGFMKEPSETTKAEEARH
jgi:hypothetical protein